MKMHPAIVLVTLSFSFLVTTCNLPKDAVTQTSTRIDWEDLQLTPRTNANFVPRFGLKSWIPEQ
jgi:hypothetical protein